MSCLSVRSQATYFPGERTAVFGSSPVRLSVVFVTFQSLVDLELRLRAGLARHGGGSVPGDTRFCVHCSSCISFHSSGCTCLIPACLHRAMSTEHAAGSDERAVPWGLMALSALVVRVLQCESS